MSVLYNKKKIARCSFLTRISHRPVLLRAKKRRKTFYIFISYICVIIIVWNRCDGINNLIPNPANDFHGIMRDV